MEEPLLCSRCAAIGFGLLGFAASCDSRRVAQLAALLGSLHIAAACAGLRGARRRPTIGLA